jgi:hypothetical protein
MKAPIPNPSPKGEGSVSILKFKKNHKFENAKNGKYFQPFELIEQIEPFERFFDTKTLRQEVTNSLIYFYKKRCE